MGTRAADEAQLHELLYQALETESGAVRVYAAASQCVRNETLTRQWQAAGERAQRDRDVLRRVLESFGLDPTSATAGREVVGHLGDALVRAIEMAHAATPGAAAELVAAECIAFAANRSRLNWQLIAHAAERSSGHKATVLLQACEAANGDRSSDAMAGWCRELWIDALGHPAVLPPPEQPAVDAARVAPTPTR